MPTNLPPDYFEIEKRFRAAESAAEKARLLEEMYSVVPKHKGTDHLRADLRRQLSKLKEEAQQARKKRGGAPVFQIDREGAGQAALVGAANTGKSALLRALTNAEPEISPAPFTTWKPTPGMLPFENVQIQLIDTPPLDPSGFVEAALFDLMRRVDVLLAVVDLQADPLRQLDETLALLEEHRIAPKGREQRFAGQERMLFKPMIVLANKCDDIEMEESCAVFCELIEAEFPVLPISVQTGFNFALLKRRVYESLGVIRVFARPPGQEPDLERPFVMKAGGTVEELALHIHKDFYENLKSARVWGSSAFDGQMVPRDYVLQEGDIVELKA